MCRDDNNTKDKHKLTIYRLHQSGQIPFTRYLQKETRQSKLSSIYNV